MFTCSECNTKFEFQYQLILHRNCHKTTSVSLDAFENRNEQDEEKYACGRCSMEFSKQSWYIEHIQKHNQNDNKCSICSKVFASNRHQARNLENHLRLHTRETPFKCKICNKPFIRKDKLIAHERTHAAEFSCASCQKIFDTKKKLLAHLREGHDRSALYECSYCPKKYTRKQHLQMHLCVHTSELPHICQYCGQRFWRGSHLTSHENIHEFDTTTMECLCAVCGERIFAISLKEHIEEHHQGTHKFQCKTYMKSFVKKGNLLFHEKTHQGKENK